MTNVDKINNKLQYEKYYNPSFNWNNSAFYYFDKNVFTDQFINVFKDKINFLFLYTYNKVNLNIIEKYVTYYDRNTWSVLVNDYKQLFTVNFINKYHMFFKFPLPKDMYENNSNITWNAKGYLNYLRELSYPEKLFK